MNVSALALELAKCLQLVVPASMTTDDRTAWIAAAVDALEDIRADEVAAVSAELRRSVTRVSQIVPEIASLVGDKRRRFAKGFNAAPPRHAAERAIDEEARDRWQKAVTRPELEAAWAWERRARQDAGLHVMPIAPPLSRDELDTMAENVASLGIECGLLQRVNGQLQEVRLA